MVASSTTRGSAADARAGRRGDGPPLLALTGGIGSGKSTALAELARLGATTLSSDDAVARLYAEPAVIAAVRERFGDAVMTAEGAVDRSALGEVAFRDPDAIAFLEELIHPRVGEARRRWVAEERARRPPPPLLVCEVPLLFEVGAERDFDGVLVVTAPESVRRKRVEARGQEFDRRRARQLDEAEKVARATESFVNDGDEDALARWAGEVFSRFAVTPER